MCNGLSDSKSLEGRTACFRAAEYYQSVCPNVFSLTVLVVDAKRGYMSRLGTTGARHRKSLERSCKRTACFRAAEYCPDVHASTLGTFR